MPQDQELAALARRVAEEAKVGRVTFFGTKVGDDDVVWSAIFQDGPRRATVQLQQRPSEADAEDLSTAMRSWANYRSDGAVYTTEVPPLPSSEWS